MTKYYFLGTLLPDLNIDQKPDIGFAEFEQLLHDNLSNTDLAKVKTVRHFFDINNLHSYIKGEPLDPTGNLDANEIEEALITQSILPSYVFDFFNKYENKESRLTHLPQLFAQFFQNEIPKASGAFKQFLVMERELRLILVAFRSKKLGRDLIKELQYEDPEDEFVAQIIAQKDAPEYEFPEKYQDFKTLLEKTYNDPIAFQKAFCEYRFQKIDELIGLDLFSMDRILAYMIKLIMIEKWLHLDKQKGLEIVDTILKEPS